MLRQQYISEERAKRLVQAGYYQNLQAVYAEVIPYIRRLAGGSSASLQQACDALYRYYKNSKFDSEDDNFQAAQKHILWLTSSDPKKFSPEQQQEVKLHYRCLLRKWTSQLLVQAVKNNHLAAVMVLVEQPCWSYLFENAVEVPSKFIGFRSIKRWDEKRIAPGLVTSIENAFS